MKSKARKARAGNQRVGNQCANVQLKTDRCDCAGNCAGLYLRAVVEMGAWLRLIITTLSPDIFV